MTDAQRKLALYLHTQKKGYKAIANTLNISVNTIKSYLRKHSTTLLISNMNANTSFCLQCGKEITRTVHKKEKKFCCDKCRCEWWNSHRELIKRKKIYELVCKYCHKSFISYANPNRHYCSHQCYINERFKK